MTGNQSAATREDGRFNFTQFLLSLMNADSDASTDFLLFVMHGVTIVGGGTVFNFS